MDYFKDLLDIMSKEVALYRELHAIEEQKKNIIVNNDVRALDAITQREQGFVKTIVQLESLRTKAVDGLCRERGTQPVDNLQQVYRMLAGDERQSLEQKEQALVSVIQEVKGINQLNDKLIEQSLDYIDVTLSIAREIGVDEAGYSKAAKDRAVKSGRGIFDAKV